MWTATGGMVLAQGIWGTDGMADGVKDTGKDNGRQRQSCQTGVLVQMPK